MGNPYPVQYIRNWSHWPGKNIPEAIMKEFIMIPS